MQFTYTKQTFTDLTRAQEGCFLLTNGLGGYASLSGAFSMTRADQGLLVAARTAPHIRMGLLARMGEALHTAQGAVNLSTQDFADDTPAEDGWRQLSCFTAGDVPCWDYDVRGVHVRREVAMARGRNAVALRYTVHNRSGAPCTLVLRPWVLGFEKGHAPLKKWPARLEEGCIITGEGRRRLLRSATGCRPTGMMRRTDARRRALWPAAASCGGRLPPGSARKCGWWPRMRPAP